MSTTKPVRFVQTCPRCLVNAYTPYDVTGLSREHYQQHPYPALSRADNKTYICSPCGTDEAMMDFTGAELPGPDHWPVKTPSTPLSKQVMEAEERYRHLSNVPSQPETEQDKRQRRVDAVESVLRLNPNWHEMNDENRRLMIEELIAAAQTGF